MKKFYFTFGSIHVLPNRPEFRKHPMWKKSLLRSFVTIQDDDEETAMAVMFARYGRMWSMCYYEEEFLPQISAFKLEQIEEIIPSYAPKADQNELS